MTFWHMDEANGIPAVTLCDEHALLATNYSFALAGLDQYDSMQAAVAMLDALEAMFGGGEPIGSEITSFEVGSCDACNNSEPFSMEEEIA